MTRVIVQRNDGNLVLVQGQPSTVVLDRPAARTVAITVPGPPGPPGAPGQPGVDAGGQIAPHAFSWGDAPVTVFTAPSDGVLAVVRVQFTTAFNGSGAAVEVGTPADPDAALPAAWNSPYTTYEYENTPDLMLTEGTQVRLTVTPGTASAGAGLLFLTFLPTA